jgi:hypothetical protein
VELRIPIANVPGVEPRDAGQAAAPPSLETVP